MKVLVTVATSVEENEYACTSVYTEVRSCETSVEMYIFGANRLISIPMVGIA